MTTLRADVIRSYSALDGLRDEWNTLADHHRQALLRHEWFACCARHLYAETDLRVVAVRRSGTLVALAPLAWSGAYGTGRVELMGSSSLHEPCNLLYRDAEALQMLVREMIDLGSPLALRRIPSATAADVMRAEVPRALRIIRQASPSLAVRLMPTWDGYIAGRSGHLRKSLRHSRSRAARSGPVTIETTVPSPEAIDDLLASFMMIEASGWKGRAGSALVHRPALQAFFAAYLREAAGQRMVRVSTLRVDQTIAAMHIAIAAYGGLWEIKIAHDERWAACSPGFQLTGEMLRYSIETHLDTYEFLGSADAWEERWGTERRDYSIVLMYPVSIAGGCGLAADVAQQVWRKTAARLFQTRSQSKVHG